MESTFDLNLLARSDRPNIQLHLIRRLRSADLIAKAVKVPHLSDDTVATLLDEHSDAETATLVARSTDPTLLTVRRLLADGRIHVLRALLLNESFRVWAIATRDTITDVYDEIVSALLDRGAHESPTTRNAFITWAAAHGLVVLGPHTHRLSSALIAEIDGESNGDEPVMTDEERARRALTWVDHMDLPTAEMAVTIGYMLSTVHRAVQAGDRPVSLLDRVLVRYLDQTFRPADMPRHGGLVFSSSWLPTLRDRYDAIRPELVRSNILSPAGEWLRLPRGSRFGSVLLPLATHDTAEVRKLVYALISPGSETFSELLAASRTRDELVADGLDPDKLSQHDQFCEERAAAARIEGTTSNDIVDAVRRRDVGWLGTFLSAGSPAVARVRTALPLCEDRDDLPFLVQQLSRHVTAETCFLTVVSAFGIGSTTNRRDDVSGDTLQNVVAATSGLSPIVPTEPTQLQLSALQDMCKRWLDAGLDPHGLTGLFAHVPEEARDTFVERASTPALAALLLHLADHGWSLRAMTTNVLTRAPEQHDTMMRLFLHLPVSLDAPESMRMFSDWVDQFDTRRIDLILSMLDGFPGTFRELADATRALSDAA